MALVARIPMTYEEARQQRVEENKRRMEELGLMSLSKELRVPSSTAPKKTMKRKMPSLEDLGMQARRSSRVAGKPMVSYRDQLDIFAGMHSRCSGRERQPLARRYMSDRARMAAIDAAEEVFKGITNPAFVKPMLHSHTASGFWLGLPAIFCKSYLPHRDERIMLEDPEQKEWECVYLANKVGLSGGWRGFSLDHDLVDGDCLIFELVSGLRFKVYIFRANGQDDAGEEDDLEETTMQASEELATEKKVSKAIIKKKTPNTAPADLDEPRKLSFTEPKKLELNDAKEGDANGGVESLRPSKNDLQHLKREAETGIIGFFRASKRRCVKEEAADSNGKGTSSLAARGNGQKARAGTRKGKEPEEEDVIELDSAGGENGGDDDVANSTSQGNTNRASSGGRSLGRVTRNSSQR